MPPSPTHTSSHCPWKAQCNDPIYSSILKGAGNFLLFLPPLDFKNRRGFVLIMPNSFARSHSHIYPWWKSLPQFRWFLLRICRRAGRWAAGWAALWSTACTGSPPSGCPVGRRPSSGRGSAPSQTRAWTAERRGRVCSHDIVERPSDSRLPRMDTARPAFFPRREFQYF